MRCHPERNGKCEDKFQIIPKDEKPCNIIHTPDTITFSNAVAKETVFIALTMGVLHNLEVKAANILNAYTTAPNHKKIWTVSSPEFGDNAGNSAIIVRV